MTTFMKNGIEVEMPEDDEKSRQNMIIAAEFMARMIRKYGDKVLAKIEGKKDRRESNMTEDEIKARNEERRAKLDAVSRRNMEKCAAFITSRIVRPMHCYQASCTVPNAGADSGSFLRVIDTHTESRDSSIHVLRLYGRGAATM